MAERASPEHIKHFTDQMRYVDELAQVVLKGHLLIEEALWTILTKLFFIPNRLKILGCGLLSWSPSRRSLSLDEHNNPMWNLIMAINALRNELAHNLEGEKRANKIQRIRELYAEICKNDEGTAAYLREEDYIVVSFAASLCCGFLLSMEKEVERFRSAVNGLDHIMNPHRHE